MEITASILMLTKDRLETLQETLPKILDSLTSNMELLIWDNGSEEGTADWLFEYSRADTRITSCTLHKSNIGMMAINELAQKATGKYIIKVDDDALVPPNFTSRMIHAYEMCAMEKLIYLTWDIPWKNGKTFATRSGMRLYHDPKGTVCNINNTERLLITYNPAQWLVNGICRLSLREKFLEVGGHPKNVLYGVDSAVSKAAQKHGYWTGFLTGPDLVKHIGHDTPAMRKFKDAELRKHKAPKHL